VVERRIDEQALFLSAPLTDTNARPYILDLSKSIYGGLARRNDMATLVVIGYESEVKAEEVRLALLKMQKDYLIDLADAVVVVRDAQGKVRLRQLYNLTAAGALSGGFWGTLVGLLFLNPLFGFAVGAGAGAISGALQDVGIDDGVMKKLAEALKPGTAALCVLIRQMTTDKVLAEIQKFGGTVIKTNLCHENEAKLREALSVAQSQAAAPPNKEA
jgi:uncharacterized membrane protein